MSLVYLAGAIDLVSKEERNNWRTDAKKVLNEYGISTIDPTGTFSYVRSESEQDRRKTSLDLIKINKMNMMMADVVLIVLSKDKPSIGTPIELWMCAEAKKEVVVLWDANPTDFIPAYIEGLVHPRDIVYNFERAMELVIEKSNRHIDNLEAIDYNKMASC